MASLIPLVACRCSLPTLQGFIRVSWDKLTSGAHSPRCDSQDKALLPHDVLSSSHTTRLGSSYRYLLVVSISEHFKTSPGHVTRQEGRALTPGTARAELDGTPQRHLKKKKKKHNREKKPALTGREEQMKRPKFPLYLYYSLCSLLFDEAV